jgi:hypothetical protein
MAKAARPVRFRDRWRIRWIDHDGKRRSAVFDSEREAQIELDARRTEAREIRRGLRKAPPQEKTFDQIAHYWLEHRTPLKRNPHDDRSIVRKHLRPTFGGLPLRAISTERIEAFKTARAHLAAQTVRHHLNLLGGMLKLAVKLGWLVDVTCGETVALYRGGL